MWLITNDDRYPQETQRADIVATLAGLESS